MPWLVRREGGAHGRARVWREGSRGGGEARGASRAGDVCRAARTAPPTTALSGPAARTRHTFFLRACGARARQACCPLSPISTHSHENTSADAAPRKPKKGDTTSPAQVAETADMVVACVEGGV